MINETKLLCSHCGKIFYRYTPSIKRNKKNKYYCSRKCASQHNLEGEEHPKFVRRTKSICQYCKKEFEHRITESKKFCSKKCSNRYNGQLRILPLVTIKCSWCNKEYKVRRYYAKDKEKNNNNTYCSRGCLHKYLATLIAKQRYNFKGHKRKMFCVICGTPKDVRFSMQKRFKTCSLKCSSILSNINNSRTSKIEDYLYNELIKVGLEPIRQYPFENYVIDFAFPDIKLAIECDGTYWHNLENVKQRDDKKDIVIKNNHWEIIRIPEKDIKEDIKKVIDLIKYKISNIEI